MMNTPIGKKNQDDVWKYSIVPTWYSSYAIALNSSLQCHRGIIKFSVVRDSYVVVLPGWEIPNKLVPVTVRKTGERRVVIRLIRARSQWPTVPSCQEPEQFWPLRLRLVEKLQPGFPGLQSPQCQWPSVAVRGREFTFLRDGPRLWLKPWLISLESQTGPETHPRI